MKKLSYLMGEHWRGSVKGSWEGLDFLKKKEVEKDISPFQKKIKILNNIK